MQLHPDASSRFNARADALSANVSGRVPPGQASGRIAPPFHAPHVQIEGPIIEEIVDLTGDLGFLRRIDSHESLGVYGQAYVELNKLAEAIQSSAALRDLVSIKFLRAQLFSWILLKHRGEAGQSCMDAILPAVEVSVQEWTLYMPISGLTVQSNFSLGKVQICSFDRSIFDESEQFVRTRPDATDEQRTLWLGWIEHKRKEYQAFGAARLTIRAEKERAIELGLDWASEAVGVLRLFSDANYRGSETCCCELKGQLIEPQQHVFFVHDGRIGSSDHSMQGASSLWSISLSDLADFRALGLDTLGLLLTKAIRSPFESDVLSAVLLYARGATKRDLSDRLVYQFAGIESLLLADGQEGIVQNISERMAFALETSVDSRQAVIKAVKEAYALRSGFVHHGRAVRDIEVFEEFAAYGWRFFTMLSRNLHFPDKSTFIKALETIKFS